MLPGVFSTGSNVLKKARDISRLRRRLLTAPVGHRVHRNRSYSQPFQSRLAPLMSKSVARSKVSGVLDYRVAVQSGTRSPVTVFVSLFMHEFSSEFRTASKPMV